MSRDDRNDAYLDSDIGYPDRRAQRRGHLFLVFLIFAAGVVALIGGVLEGAREIASAFPSAEALGEGAAWTKFFAGLGRLGIVGLIVILAALILRWRIRRKRRV